MGLFDTLFGGNLDFSADLARAQQQIFRAYGITTPTDSQKFRNYFALCMAGIAVLNAAKGSNSQRPVGALVDNTHKLVKSLQFPAGELTLDEADLAIMFTDFPTNIGIKRGTLINGTGGLDAALNTAGQMHVMSILEKSQGPFGMPASAALYVGDFTFGEGKSRDHFLELSQTMLQYAQALIR